jgi:hypothetical protein
MDIIKTVTNVRIRFEVNLQRPLFAMDVSFHISRIMTQRDMK